MTFAADPARCQRAQTIVHKVLGLGDDERRAHIEQACGDDTALRAEVEWLIGSVEATDAPGRLASPTWNENR